MSIFFKLFEITVSDTEEVLFQAYVKDEKTYRITEDLTGRFKYKFFEIIKGTYSHKFYNEQEEEFEVYQISEGDALSNLEKYIRDCHLFSDTEGRLINSDISSQFTLHFIGSDYNMDKGMDPSAAKKASDFFYELGRLMITPTTANNTNYKPEEFTTYEAASLKMEMFSSYDFPIFRTIFQQFLEDIERGQLSTSQAIGDNYHIYKKLILIFKELRKFNNLYKLKIDIRGFNGGEITDTSKLSNLSSNLYGHRKMGVYVIQSVNDYYRDTTFDGLIVDTRNLTELTTWKYFKNDILSKFLLEQKGENVRLEGITTGEKSRELNSIEFVRENFNITNNDRRRLTSNGININGNKLIITN